MTKSDNEKANQQEQARAAVRDLVRRARDTKGLTRDEIAALSGASPKTIWNFESGARWPLTRVLRGLETALGFTSGVLDDVLDSDNPASVTLDHLWAVNEEEAEATQGLNGVSDQDLVWALTERLQSRDATILRLTEENQRLREQLADTDHALPANVYDLAADKDRSGHGRALRDAIDQAGEEPQDR